MTNFERRLQNGQKTEHQDTTSKLTRGTIIPDLSWRRRERRSEPQASVSLIHLHLFMDVGNVPTGSTVRDWKVATAGKHTIQ